MPALQRRADSLEKEAIAPGVLDNARNAHSKMPYLAAVRGELGTRHALARACAGPCELVPLAVERAP